MSARHYLYSAAVVIGALIIYDKWVRGLVGT